jgi:hypothetical protein
MDLIDEVQALRKAIETIIIESDTHNLDSDEIVSILSANGIQVKKLHKIEVDIQIKGKRKHNGN